MAAKSKRTPEPRRAVVGASVVVNVNGGPVCATIARVIPPEHPTQQGSVGVLWEGWTHFVPLSECVNVPGCHPLTLDPGAPPAVNRSAPVVA